MEGYGPPPLRALPLMDICPPFVQNKKKPLPPRNPSCHSGLFQGPS